MSAPWFGNEHFRTSEPQSPSAPCSSSSSHLHRHVISILAASTTQLVLSKKRLVRQRLNTAALTSPCIFPLSSCLPFDPARWPRRRRSRHPSCTFWEILLLGLSHWTYLVHSSRSLPFFYHVSPSNRGPRPLRAGIADDTCAVVQNTFLDAP